MSSKLPSRQKTLPNIKLRFIKKSPTKDFIKKTLLVPYVRGQTCMTRHTRGGKIGQVLQKSIIIVMWKMLTSKSISTPDLPKTASVRGLLMAVYGIMLIYNCLHVY